jgi:hypothetical protein
MSDAVVLGQPVLNPSPQYRYVRTVRMAPSHPSSIALMACWRELEAKGGMRMGRDIPSRALVKLLPHILITEPIDNWEDARIRLAGTAMLERFGRDIAGTLVSQIYENDLDGAQLLLHLGRCATESREPGVVDTRIFVDGIEMMHLEIVLMPINSADGSGVWNLVGAFRF